MGSGNYYIFLILEDDGKCDTMLNDPENRAGVTCGQDNAVKT